MQELGKALEEMEKKAFCIDAYYVHRKCRDEEDLYVSFSDAQDIIRRHMNNGWIPCSERLPEESLDSVLGFDEYRERCCLVQYVGGRWVLGSDADSVKIIAWQPLPEPYQPDGYPEPKRKTNFDYCCQSAEIMAQVIDIAKCGWTKEEIINWLQSEAKEI